MSLRLLAALVSFMLAACGSTPEVYSSNDRLKDPPSGSFPGLAQLLPNKPGPLRVVFVHGVGDHCPGYALDPADGWLNDDAAKAVGLTPLDDEKAPPAGPIRIPTSVFMHPDAGAAEDDPRSFVAYATRHFKLQTSAGERDVEAVEITWSPLTQWLKSNQLGYDSPSTTPGPGAQRSGCLEPPDASVTPAKHPPKRLWLDKILKEGVFNRNLADAMLYVGPYGMLIQRGVAEAMCRAFTGHTGPDACQWSSLRGGHVNLFITHSLGSRITYDTLLGLLGYHGPGERPAFTDNEWQPAQGAIKTVLAETPAFYLMANQLALLGLANVPMNVLPSDGPGPFAVPDQPVLEIMATPVARVRRFTSQCDYVLEAFGEAAAAARAQAKLPAAPKMQIVAFNDTNDLLTWHIPPWYANSGKQDAAAARCRPAIDVTNVFVQNALKLLVLELPDAAHGGYFKNERVWQAIYCGADIGRIRDCEP